MSLRRTLDAMAVTVGRAKSVPLSASCVVNRAELLSLVERARAELPAELDDAAALLVAHQEVIEGAEREGERLVEEARGQVEELLAESAVVATAEARAEQILDAARVEAARLLREADAYCDGRLAEFETDLERAVAQVRRGRDRLRERSDLERAVEGVDVMRPGAAGEAAEEDPDQPFDGQAVAAEVAAEGGAGRLTVEQPGPDRVIDLAAAERAGLGAR